MKRLFFLSSLFFIVWIISCKKEYSCEGCANKNKPPVAFAGPDGIIALPTDSILLDGSGSSDPDGKISEWLWTKISGPASFSIAGESSSKTSVRNLVAGVYQFELTVTDNGGLSAKDTIMITVDATPITKHPPVANAGRDIVIILPASTIILDGSKSVDPDNNISSYQWTKVSGPQTFNISDSNAAMTQVTGLTQGVYQFQLKVTDTDNLLSMDTVQIVVNNASNHAPAACAGPDQIITLPTNTVVLDGSCSTDSDNNIVSYSWSKISGPTTFNIANANGVQTQANGLAEGVYQFELKVTDAAGAFDRDTVQVTVKAQLATLPPCDNSNRPVVNAQLIPVGTLSLARSYLDAASAGNKILFAGGFKNSGAGPGHSSRVDIYDLTTQTWSTAELCVPRVLMAAVAAGNKIFFAGGEYSDGTMPVDSVDIYDVSTNIWAVNHLSKAGSSIAATTIGNKLFFAGGDGGFSGKNRETTVDIYDLSIDTWSVASLSNIKRGGHSAVTAGSKVYIAGGQTWVQSSNSWQASNTVDIYDNSTNTWSTSMMFEGKQGLGGIVVNNNIYWAGGQTGVSPNMQRSCVVEIRDLNTGNSSIQYLSKSGTLYEPTKTVIMNNKIIFFGSDTYKFDIYDTITNTWSIGNLAQPIPVGASVISVNNTIYIAGGEINGNWNNLSKQVWKLEF
jgi:N-acetylneuraminic acid mutarotase